MISRSGVERIEVAIAVDGDLRSKKRVVSCAVRPYEPSFAERPDVEPDFMEVGEIALFLQHGDVLLVQDHPIPLVGSAAVEVLEKAVQPLLSGHVGHLIFTKDRRGALAPFYQHSGRRRSAFGLPSLPVQEVESQDEHEGVGHRELAREEVQEARGQGQPQGGVEGPLHADRAPLNTYRGVG